MRNPITKLTNNWFGDREKGLATGICIMAGPVGILICKVLIQTIMWNDDKLPENSNRGRLHYEFFLIANTLVITLMLLPSFFMIREKPPSPPSKVASKVRPHFSMKEAWNLIMSNRDYLIVFVHFQLVNSISFYGGEITTFLRPYP